MLQNLQNRNCLFYLNESTTAFFALYIVKSNGINGIYTINTTNQYSDKESEFRWSPFVFIAESSVYTFSNQNFMAVKKYGTFG